MADIKPPTSYVDQIKKLESKGFIIDVHHEAIAFLQRANYYRLSAYLLPFRDKEGKYAEGVSLTRIQQIYMFDSNLASWLYVVIGEIERYLRTQLSYHLGHKYGPIGYLKYETFSDKHNHEVFLGKITTCIQDNANTLVVKHHNTKYAGNFPIWVIIEYFSTGMLSFLFSDLHTIDQKTIASNSFHTGVPQLTSWLRSLTDLRNKVAHYTRFYYWNFASIPKNTNGACQYRMDRTLFSQILMLRYLYPRAADWKYRYEELRTLLKEFDHFITLKHIGFPKNWDELLRSS